MAGRSTTVNLNYSMLEDIPEEIIEDKNYQENLSQLYLKLNLIENLTPAISKLKVLTELYLHSNNLVTLPDAIGELSSLTRLNLDSNQLSSLNSCIGNLSNLEYLNISGNKLTALPKELWKCRSLLSVNASVNRINSLDPSIVQCESLQRLCLDSNELVELPPQLCCVRSLRELSFSGNKLESIPADIYRLSNLTSLLVDAHPKLISFPASLVFCQSLSVLGIEGCGGNSLLAEKLLNGSTWYVDEVLYGANARNQFRTPAQSLQELAARRVHQSLTVTTHPNWIWLQDDLHEVLNLPRVLCAYLIPAIHCVLCGVPIMSLSYYAIVNCSCSQRGAGLSPLLKAMEKWFTSLSHHVGRVLCGCDDRETSGLHHLAGSGRCGGLTECDILLKFQERNLMLRFDFCSKRCGDAFIDSIFTITL